MYIRGRIVLPQKNKNFIRLWGRISSNIIIENRACSFRTLLIQTRSLSEVSASAADLQVARQRRSIRPHTLRITEIARAPSAILRVRSISVQWTFEECPKLSRRGDGVRYKRISSSHALNSRQTVITATGLALAAAVAEPLTPFTDRTGGGWGGGSHGRLLTHRLYVGFYGESRPNTTN